MTIDEIARLVSRIAITDNRTVDKTTLRDWEEILPDWLTYEQAMRAVIQHRRTSTEYLLPAHVVAIAESNAPPSIKARLALPANAITLDEYARRHPEDLPALRAIYHRNPGRWDQPAFGQDEASE